MNFLNRPTYKVHRRCSTIVVMVLLVFIRLIGHADQPARNTITFDNQSGRNAVVRVMGPTQAIAKMQRDETRVVHVTAGEYYILVRYGDSPKEYAYTRSDPFLVTQTEEKYSIITFILHRRSGGTFNSQPVSGHEFEGDQDTSSSSTKP